MLIRKCTINDVDAVYQLMNDLESLVFDCDDFKDKYFNMLNDNKHYMYVAEENEVLGFIHFIIFDELHHIKKVSEIKELIINEKHRNKNIGLKLLNHALEISSLQDCELVELTSSTKREKAHNFYLKNGFEISSYKFKKSI